MRALVLLVALLFLPSVAAQTTPDVVHTPMTIEATLRDIEAINPDFVTVSTFGQSHGGLPLWMVDVVHPDAILESTPVFYLDANHHGNEQMGSEALLIFLRELAEWSLTPEGEARLKDVRVVGAPMINPDGTQADKRTNTLNVDLNRNYPYHWGLYGTTGHPASFNYRGAAAGSEPETQANVALMQELKPDVYLSMHTGSHDIVLPWRQTDDGDGPMPDWPVYEAWLAAIEEVSGLAYRDPSGAGESISYAYGALGAMSVIVEVTTIQFEPAQTDAFEDILKEEVAIFWQTLQDLEKLGGHLTVRAEGGNRMLQNEGWGPAINVTFTNDAGSQVGTMSRIEPGVLVGVPEEATRFSYERRMQGDDHKPVWSGRMASFVGATGSTDDNNTPLPLLVGILALLGAALVRRR